MAYISPIGRNWDPTVNWDALGKLYASIAISWTVILALGSAWLTKNRHLPFLKIRNVPLAIASVCFLQVYFVKILLAYTTNGHFLCSAEFWIMSIYLPFGIALFQANMVQLLSISTQQRKLLEGDRASIRERSQHARGIRGLWSKWKALTALKKTYFGIGIGMFLQVIVTAAIYGTNRKLQGHWGHVAKPLGQSLCRKGPEWIPSALWQLFWCCIYGPYLLFKIRNVHDTHYWRTQTILCVLSGFPGAPLWLAAVFTPGTAWKWVNRYYVPPMWLAPGIFVMQACTIFFPIYEAYHQHRLNRATTNILQTWEDNKTWDETTLGSGSHSSFTNYQCLHGSHRSPSSNADSFNIKDQQPRMPMSQCRSNEMYTTAALEKALLMNSTPLLHFAATKDFTAENILFLVAVRDWKAKWSRIRASSLPDPKPPVKRMLWREAVEIYAFGVSERYAEFPINIEWKIRTALDKMFAESVEVLSREAEGETVEKASEEGEEDPYSAVVPFASSPAEVPMKSMSPTVLGREMSYGSSSAPSTPRTTTTKREYDYDTEMPGKESCDQSVEAAPHTRHDQDELFTLPEGFDEHAFDAAEKSIKYLVVTNTWRKFVTAMREDINMALGILKYGVESRVLDATVSPGFDFGADFGANIRRKYKSHDSARKNAQPVANQKGGQKPNQSRDTPGEWPKGQEVLDEYPKEASFGTQSQDRVDKLKNGDFNEARNSKTPRHLRTASSIDATLLDGITYHNEFNADKRSRDPSRKDPREDDNGHDFTLSSFSGLPTMWELEQEYAKKLKSIKLQTGVNLEKPTLQDKLHPLFEPSVSKEDFAYMTQSLLSETSSFKDVRVEVIDKTRVKGDLSTKNMENEISYQPEQRLYEEGPQLFGNNGLSARYMSTTAEDIGGGISRTARSPEALSNPGPRWKPPTVEDDGHTVEALSEANPSCFDTMEYQAGTKKSKAGDTGNTRYEKFHKVVNLIQEGLLPSVEGRPSSMPNFDLELLAHAARYDMIPDSLTREEREVCQDLLNIVKERRDRGKQRRPRIITITDLAKDYDDLLTMMCLKELHRLEIIELEIWSDNLWSKTQPDWLRAITKRKDLLFINDTPQTDISSEYGRGNIDWKLPICKLGKLKWQYIWCMLRAIEILEPVRKLPLKAVKVLRPVATSGEYVPPFMKRGVPATALKSCEVRVLENASLKERYIKIFDPWIKRNTYENTTAQGADSEDVLWMVSNFVENKAQSQGLQGLVPRMRTILSPPDKASLSWLIEANNIRSKRHMDRAITGRAELANLPFILHRSGEILIYPYRLTKHIRTEHHGEVYDLEDLDSGIIYEAKVYTLRGIHPSQRKRRVDNLKRVTALPSFVHSFDYGGQKYCLFRHYDPETTCLSPRLGAIGRLNTPEYKAAFPELPPSTVPTVVKKRKDVAMSKLKPAPRTSSLLIWFVVPPFHAAISDKDVREIVLKELSGKADRWQAFSSPVPLALRIMIRLGELDPSWKDRADLLSKQTLSASQDNNIPPENKGRRRRRKRAPVAE
ncbi:hypothetical protein EG329_000894 [Mollisiaceae sp. DMI_Dod_QoI]|nr:hypothetical protein EG329_000894 [Helotiales sp. DMI_Dod_QoI]